MRVAYYSPLPPERSGIADYSALLLPALERRVELEVVRRGRRWRAPRADVHLYHVGNSAEAHDWIVEALRQRPGVVVLHDAVLHHLVAGLTLGRGDREAYLDAMQLEAGVVGRLLAHGVVDGLIAPLWESRAHDFPLTGAVIGSATGLIVHSRHVEEAARTGGYDGSIWRIPMPAWPQSERVEEPAGARTVRIGCLGNLNPSKRVPELLAAFAQLRREGIDARLLLAGEARGLDLDEMLADAGLAAGEDVEVTGYVEEERLWSLLAACDVCVSLRWPTMGETSGSAIRALSLGKPLVVSDVGWFSELPDSVAAKVPVDERETELLAAVLGRLARDGELRRKLGEEARAYARREHDLEHTADLYLATLEEAAGGEAVERETLGEVARAAREVGLDAHPGELRELGRRAREVDLGR